MFTEQEQERAAEEAARQQAPAAPTGGRIGARVRMKNLMSPGKMPDLSVIITGARCTLHTSQPRSPVSSTSLQTRVLCKAAQRHASGHSLICAWCRCRRNSGQCSALSGASLALGAAGQELHAPLVERLIELPMDISGGRINGDLRLRARDDATWHFPSFGGRLQCDP